MLFQTVEFVVFYVVVATACFLYSRERRNLLLLFASYYFYMSWDARFGALILLSTAIDFLCCRAIEDRPGRRRLWLVLSVGSNLAVLGFFKYFDFFARSLGDLLALAGVGVRPPVLDLVLPVGISFFTFQSMSHTIDVYRGHMRAERSFRDFALFVAFFPQLVAGPIVRARDFLPQLGRRFAFSWARLQWGLERFLLGLVKKVVVADNLSLVVDLVYADPGAFDTKTVWLATVCYAVQIYCDFSGYSDMAIGMARILGFKLPENFHLPYRSRTPSEFWRRWHVSLSTWLRDYLYIPLGGNRGSALATKRNLMLTMLLGGLWHGASYNFVLWGGVHGALLVVYGFVERRFLPFVPARLRATAAARGSATLVFFLLVLLTWVPFRAATLSDTGVLLERMVVAPAGGLDWSSMVGVDLPLVSAILLAVLLVHLAGDRLRTALSGLYARSAALRAVGVATLLFVVVQFQYTGRAPFVYFQF